LAVEEMRRGSSPSYAGEVAIKRIISYYPNFVGAIVVLKRDGEYGAACHGLQSFQFSVCNSQLRQVTVQTVQCVD
jgi:Asparaginase.